MDYIGIRSRASALITKNGKSITIQTPVAGTFDPATGVNTPGTPTTKTVKAVESNYSQAERNGTSILMNDRMFLVSGLDTSGAVIVQPTTSDKLIIGADTLSIVKVDPIKPGDTAVIYEVQARK
jgi:hypothetical protein